jgi:hypothetical protein
VVPLTFSSKAKAKMEKRKSNIGASAEESDDCGSVGSSRIEAGAILGGREL